MDLRRCDDYLNSLSASATSQEEGHPHGEAPRRLNEPEVYGLCDQLGLARCPAAWLTPDGDREAWADRAAALADGRGRLLLKVVGREILHKTEVGGVRVVELGAGGRRDALLRIATEMLTSLAAGEAAAQVEGLLAASFVPHTANRPGQELLLGLRQDPAFGPCVVVGVGGTLTEWYGRGSGGRSTLVFPARDLEPDTVVSALTAHQLLRLMFLPSRLYPEPPLVVAEVARVVSDLAALGHHCGPTGPSPFTLEEVEINPAVAGPHGLTALDGVGLISRRKQPESPRSLDRIKSLLAPRSAVVMGVSARSQNPGRIILDNLMRSESVRRERLYVIHPEERDIAGVPCFPAVGELPERCDLAVVSIPAGGALTAIEQLVAHDRAESIILIPGGFAEAGEADLAQAIEDTVRQGHARPGGGPVLVGGNCLGIVSRDCYNTFFLPEYKLPFNPGHGRNLAMVSQSGAYLVTFASNHDGVILPRASISFGNQMDLTAADFLEHFLDEAPVDVIACYVEGFRAGDGERFVARAREARRRGKRVIVFKAGRTALGAQAAASHTASLAGDYAVARACLESAGVTVAESLDNYEDLIKTFTLLAGHRPRGRRTGIISNAGFECSTVTDELNGLELARFDAATQAVLDEFLPPFAHRNNPIDCTPMTGTAAFAASCRAILNCPTVDAAILASVPVTPALNNLPADPDGRHGEDIADPTSQPALLIEILAGSAKPAVIVVDSGRIYDPMCRMIEQAGLPVFRKIDRAARALAAFCQAEED